MTSRRLAVGVLLILSLVFLSVGSAQELSGPALLRTLSDEEVLKLQPGGGFDAMVHFRKLLSSSTDAGATIVSAGPGPKVADPSALIQRPNEEETVIVMPGGAFDAYEKPKPPPAKPPVSVTPPTPPVPVIPPMAAPEAVQKVVKLPDGSTYYGWLRGNLPEGFGVRFYKNGSSHAGFWRGDKRSGRGIFRGADRSSYAGEWAAGKYHGTGIFTWSTGIRYAGQWDAGRMQGFGDLAYPDGRRFTGKWAANKLAAASALPQNLLTSPVLRPPGFGVTSYKGNASADVQGLLLDVSEGQAWLLQASDRKTFRFPIARFDTATQALFANWKAYFQPITKH